MQIFIFSPNAKSLFNDDQKNLLTSLGEVYYYDRIPEVSSIVELKSIEEKVIALDPDACDWKTPNEELSIISNLKAVCLQTTSFSWIDSALFAAKGIPVTNLRGFSSVAVAEWAIMNALMLARKIPVVIKEGWQEDFVRYQGVELRGKVAGIVGLGNIGTKIAEYCLGLGMEVLYWSRNSRDERFDYNELESLMKNADFVFPVVAQNKNTEGLLSDELLKAMKNSAVFVSMIHHVYNHDLLVDMISKGELFGYAFEEGAESFDKYKGNILATPSLAWATDGSMKRNAEQWIECIVKAVKGEFGNRVN